MDRYDEIAHAIREAIEELNEKAGPNDALEIAPTTVLIGPESKLDSLGIITLITAVEDRVERRLNEQISLIDAIASAARSWTVEDMTNAIAKMIGEPSRA